MSSEDSREMSDGADGRDALRDMVVAAAQEGADQELPSEKPAELDESMNEEDVLRNLTGGVRDQDDLERDITLQATTALNEAEDKKDRNRIEKLEVTRGRLKNQLEKEKKQLVRDANNPYKSRKLQATIDKLQSEMTQISNDISDFQSRIDKRNAEDPMEDANASKSARLPGESHRDYLIRTGKITPFAKVGGPRPPGLEGGLADTILEAENEASIKQLDEGSAGPTSHQLLRRPGFADELEADDSETGGTPKRAVESEFSLRPRKKQKVVKRERSPSADFEPSGESDSDDFDPRKWQQANEDDLIREEQREQKKKAKSKEADNAVDLSKVDDGNEVHYKGRLRDWVDRRSRARRARRQKREDDDGNESGDDVEEWRKPAPDFPDQVFDDGLKLPGDIHPSLFGYQKTGVQWLSELYKQQVGGIVGDEMGLGKTVQLIAFIAALHYSGRLNKPVIVVAPATLLRQWVGEFHRWWPPLRVSILHSSGSGMLNPEREDNYDLNNFSSVIRRSRNAGAAKHVVNTVVKKGHVLVTTYTGLQTYADELLGVEWEYAVLDEGHKIRNPNADITLTCKELNTPNRVILSGTPVQNNLTELWSLFDFIYPMRLGTLVSFREHFEIPIKHGGYANASNVQVVTAEKCAEALKEAISEYLLQRLKVDVAADLPEKTEQVLFCKLTPSQRKAYESFLGSEEVTAILSKKRQSLYGIDILRKICNHPDLLDKSLRLKDNYDFGSPKNSTKLLLTMDLLQKIMIPNGHKTLLFSQSKQMLGIIEKRIREGGINYVRMDGETPIDARQPMIDRFNTNPDIHVFLMTTRTGGLGTNLTGADRIIIFDPDWNPSTDLQARERAWRLGQTKPVKIYRLMTEGTIEEKIYHRQIFKQFITNKVLKDAKQRTSYDLSDLYDLFSYKPSDVNAADRPEAFRGAEVKLKAEAAAEGKGEEEEEEEGKGLLQDMDMLANVEDFKEERQPEDEKRMLDGIFAKSVNSAYDHEQIINGPGRKVQPSLEMLHEAAGEVSRAAAAHLRRSGVEARRVPVGTVTWTGEFGQRPPTGGNRHQRGGPGRNGRAGTTTGSSSSGTSRYPPPPSASTAAVAGGSQQQRTLKAKDFRDMIVNFMKINGGKVATKMLVDHFNPYCHTQKNNEDFQAALNGVATLHKPSGSGRGIWNLKPGLK